MEGAWNSVCRILTTVTSHCDPEAEPGGETREHSLGGQPARTLDRGLEPRVFSFTITPHLWPPEACGALCSLAAGSESLGPAPLPPREACPSPRHGSRVPPPSSPEASDEPVSAGQRRRTLSDPRQGNANAELPDGRSVCLVPK